MVVPRLWNFRLMLSICPQEILLFRVRAICCQSHFTLCSYQIHLELTNEFRPRLRWCRWRQWQCYATVLIHIGICNWSWVLQDGCKFVLSDGEEFEHSATFHIVGWSYTTSLGDRQGSMGIEKDVMRREQPNRTPALPKFVKAIAHVRAIGP